MKTNNIVFDIETGGLPAGDQLSIFEPKFKVDGRIKDLGKLEADRLEKQDEWLEKAALDAMRARVLVIGVMVNGKITIMEGAEDAILLELWNLWHDAGITTRWIGHNIKLFDVPFLLRRSFCNGMRPPDNIMDGRYLSSRFVDTMQTWAAGEYGCFISLDNLSRALGVGKKSESGKDFAKRYAEDRVKALEYVTQDLILTGKCALKMGLI